MKSAHKIAVFLLKNNICTNENMDIYEYGIEVMLSNIIPSIVIVVTGILLKKIPESIAFVIVFTLLRSRCGGYHAKHRIGCLVVTFICYILAVLSNKLIGDIFVCYVIYSTMFTFTVIVFLLYAPGSNTNKVIDSDCVGKYKLQSIIIATAAFVISHIGGCKYISVISVTLMECSLLLIISARKETRR